MAGGSIRRGGGALTVIGRAGADAVSETTASAIERASRSAASSVRLTAGRRPASAAAGSAVAVVLMA
jgi:hypothetical protein